MKQHLLPAILLASVFIIIGVATLSHYGMHEDSPFHFLRGQYYLERILGRSGKFALPPLRSPVMFIPGQRVSYYKPNASEELFAPLRAIPGQEEGSSLQKSLRGLMTATGSRISLYKHNAWGANIWELMDNQGHPAVSDMLMAATNRVAFEFLGVLGDVEGYHIYSLIVVAVSLVFLYAFVADAFGSYAAVISAVSLAMYPLVFAESHFNIKDPVQMGYYTMAVVSFYFTITRRLSVDWFVLFVLSVFLALGTKWNILFAPLVLIPWAVTVWWKSPDLRGIGWSRMLLFGAAGVVLPLIILVFAYPFYWTQTVYKVLNTFSYYATLAVKDLRFQQPSPVPLPGGFDGRAILYILSMSPPIMLVLAILGGLGIAARTFRGKHKAGLLIALWFFVPLFRVMWQLSEVFGSIRHFMELLPAFAVFVGVGLAGIVGWISRTPLGQKLKRGILQGVFLFAYILANGIILVGLHPYEHVYFNRFIGGIEGAQRIGLLTWESLYDMPYRKIAEWMNINAEPNARLAHLDGTMFAISPIWFRDDIHIGSFFSGFEGKGEYIASIIYPKPPAVFPYNYLMSYVQPVYEVKVDGVVVAAVWKNDLKHTKIVGVPRVIQEHELARHSSIDQGILRVDTILPTALDILTVTVEVPDIRCITVRNLVWNVIADGEPVYMFPWISDVGPTSAVLSFPGIRGKTVRYLDLEKTGCDENIRIVKITGVN